MAFSKAKPGGGNNKKKPYSLLLLLLLAFCTAITCAAVLHKLRENRLLGLLLQQREQQLAALQILLQRERETKKDLKRELDDMKAKEDAFKNQRLLLIDKISETEKTAARLMETQTKLEAALEEKRNQIERLADKTELQVANLTSLLRQREAEVEEMKTKPAPAGTLYASSMDSTEQHTAQTEKSLIRGFSGVEGNEENGEQRAGLPQKEEWSKAEIVRNISPDEALATKEVKKTQNAELNAKHTEETEAHGIYDMYAPAADAMGQNANTQTEKNSEQHDEFSQEGKWVKFQTNMDEETMKSEDVSDVNPYEAQTSEGKDGSNEEEKDTQGIEFDSRQTEGPDLRMKENDSSIDKADHAYYVNKVEQQQKTPEVSDQAARSEPKEKGRRHRRRNRVRRKMVKSTELNGLEYGQSGKIQGKEMVQESTESSIGTNGKSTGASSGGVQSTLKERSQIEEGKSSSSTDDINASVADSSPTELSTAEKGMLINMQVSDSKGGANKEGNNEISEDNQLGDS